MKAEIVDVTEQKRLNEAREEGIPWKKWGPYLSERQWGTRHIYAIKWVGSENEFLVCNCLDNLEPGYGLPAKFATRKKDAD